MANANDPKGSKWRMWDLHIHSPYTFLANEYGNLSISDYVDRLVESGVQVIGLTNYFRFADNEIEEIKPLLEEKGIAVFPNLEFRTQPENKDNEEMHVHLIFSDQTPLEKIKSFLGRLKTTDDKYCSTLTEQDIASTTVSFDSLFTKLHEDKELQHLQDYLLAACPRGQGSFRPSQTDDGRGNTLAITIDQKTDVLFGNADDTDFFLDTTRYVHAEAKPVVACSDAHSTETIAQKYTWIKADKTFEGLKQILWEPKERVKILDRNPNDTKSSRISIDRISYKGSNNTEAVVPLNKDLNSIIGVRGSGKSTLLKSIAYKIDREQFDDKDGKPPYPLNDFKVYWADGEEGGGSDKSPKSIFYIPQNYLSALAYDDGEKVRERDTFLTLLLKKNVQFSNAITRYNDFVSSNKLKIEELVQELLSANESLKEGRQLLKQQGSKEEIQGEIKKKIEEIKKYKSLTDSEITDDEMKQYSESKKKVNDNKRVLLVLSQDKVILTSLIEHGADIVIASQEFSELSEERRAAINKEILSQGNKSLEALVKKELDKINVLEAKLTGEIKTDEEVVKKLGVKINKSKALEGLTKELETLEVTLEKIEALLKQINDSDNAQKQAIDGLVKAYEQYEAQQKAVFSTISFEESFSFLNVEIVAAYNCDDLKRFVERTINTRDTDSSLKSDSDIQELFSDNPKQPSSVTVRKVIDGIVNSTIKIKVDVGDISVAISQLLKNRYEIDYLNSVKTQEGVCFKNMTGGQKAIALLELVFRFDDEKYPILIDQPEDDLDVGGVATDLVKFIKCEKVERQIIIASHNASLVICADSEEVIVSGSNLISAGKYNFSYLTGAVENPEVTEQIITVLEGGRDALRMRARKLNFKNEL